MVKTDFLIVGSGIAGLTLAIKLAQRFPKKKITVVTKAGASESNTRYAQGGIAAVWNHADDTFEKHVSDTLKAGDGLCEKEVVEKVISEGPERLRELISWGVGFDRLSGKELHLALKGGHTQPRVLHCKDQTGREIQRILISKVLKCKNVTVLPHHFVVDLISQPLDCGHRNSICVGAYVLDQISGETISIAARTVTLATGGIGRVFGHTTNPSIATGDGIAVAARAQVKIADMEFVQFHPTALYTEAKGKAFLLSEALRGAGAVLRNHAGEAFMLRYDSRGDLAPRDIVARAICSEMNTNGQPHVFLDATTLSERQLGSEFPTIYSHCRKKGYDMRFDWVPVVPAAHYCCGGIVVDNYGKTSMDNLFACGECARTGLHGANRLASNSLLEALVYAHSIFEYHCKHIGKRATSVTETMASAMKGKLPSPNFYITALEELHNIMRNHAGVVRSTQGLIQAEVALANLAKQVELHKQEVRHTTEMSELRNMVTVAQLCIGQSLLRKENKGGFFNKDLSNAFKNELV